MNSHQFEKAMHDATIQIVDYLKTVQDRPVLPSVEPGYLRKLLPECPPQKGENWASIQKDIENKIMPGMTHWQSPRFMAFFPSPVTFPSILGELYCTAMTAPAFNWVCSPAVTELEIIVLDWIAKMINLPSCYLSSSTGGGVIQGTASEAVLTAMVAARERYIRISTRDTPQQDLEDAAAHIRSRLVAIGCETAHSCTQKGAMIAGTRYRSVCATADNNFSMTGASLRAVLEQCTAQRLVPYYVTVTLGTTSTCAIDNFGDIAEVLRDYPLVWVHVDAAFAGSALVCEEFHYLTEHFHKFDSFDFNMSKWLLTTLDASCMFVKNRKDLTDALSITPSYLRNQYSESGYVTDYRDWSFALSRRFRALKLWFVLRTYGVDGLQSHIRNDIKLGHSLHSLVRSRSDLFVVIGKPQFSLVVVSISPKALGNYSTVRRQMHQANDYPWQADFLTIQEANEITELVYESIIDSGELYLTSTMVGETLSLRFVCAHPGIDEKHMRKAFDTLVRATEMVIHQLNQTSRLRPDVIG